MSTLEITLRSGATIMVKATEWKFEQRGSAKSLTWTSAERGNRLVHVDMGEVVAIVEIR